MLLDRCTQVLAGIGVIAILARAMGPTGFATFQYAQSLVYIAASVALICGGEVVIPRLVAHADATDQHRLLVHVFRLRILAALGGYLLIIAFLVITGQAEQYCWPALILGISILLREPSGVVTAWLQAHTRTRPGVLINLAALAARVGTVMALAAWSFQTASAYASAFALESILVAALLYLLYRRQAAMPSIALDPALTRQLLHDGSLFWVSFMLMMVTRRVDQLILQPHVAAVEFASYAATVQIVDNFTTLATILAGGIAPLYIYGKSDRAAAIRSVCRLAALLFAVGVIGAALLAFLAPWVVHLLYGSAFADAIDLLRLAALVSPLVFADVGFTILAVYLRRPRWIAWKWAAAGAAAVVVDVIFIPDLGARGAILGYATSSMITSVVGLGLWLHARRQQAS